MTVMITTEQDKIKQAEAAAQKQQHRAERAIEHPEHKDPQKEMN